jgi:hypothetical protein
MKKQPPSAAREGLSGHDLPEATTNADEGACAPPPGHDFQRLRKNSVQERRVRARVYSCRTALTRTGFSLCKNPRG